MQLSSISGEGVHVRLNTTFSPAYAAVYKGRAMLVMETGECTMTLFPTASELRAMAAELTAAADRVEDRQKAA